MKVELKSNFFGDLYVDPKDVINDESFQKDLEAVKRIQLRNRSQSANNQK